MVRESRTCLRKPNEIISRVIRLLCTMSIQHYFKLEHHGGGFRHFFCLTKKATSFEASALNSRLKSPKEEMLH